VRQLFIISGSTGNFDDLCDSARAPAVVFAPPWREVGRISHIVLCSIS